VPVTTQAQESFVIGQSFAERRTVLMYYVLQMEKRNGKAAPLPNGEF
jgi:hypothetical protein